MNLTKRVAIQYLYEWANITFIVIVANLLQKKPFRSILFLVGYSGIKDYLVNRDVSKTRNKVVVYTTELVLFKSAGKLSRTIAPHVSAVVLRLIRIFLYSFCGAMSAYINGDNIMKETLATGGSQVISPYIDNAEGTVWFQCFLSGSFGALISFINGSNVVKEFYGAALYRFLNEYKKIYKIE